MTPAELAVYVSLLAIALAFLALIFSLVNRRRVREQVQRELGDPTSYCVVTDGKFYRVRGPFDTFYTIRFRNRKECEQYKDQLAAWHREYFNQDNWRIAA